MTVDRQLLVMPFVVGVCAALLSLRMLPELDFGWHLATGTWILRNGSIVAIDPFGVGESQWIAYSWLFDLLLALTFSVSGYQGLQYLQAAVVTLLFISALLVYRRNSQAGSLIEIAAIFLLMILCSPFLYLRPHLFSAIFGIILIGIIQSKRVQTLPCIILGVLWANIHVYWIAVPILLFLDSIGRRDRGLLAISVLCCFCGLITPYGVETYRVLYDYAFAHNYALSSIVEFQHLGLEHGLYFYGAIINGAVLLALLFRFVKTLSLACVLFACVSICASAFQVKYLLLSGLATFWVLMSIDNIEVSNRSAARYTVLSFVASCILTFALLSCFGAIPPPRSQQQRDLDLLVSQLPAEFSGVVLNHFDSGGALAWYFLQRKLGLRTSIDGRTLVMGKSRINQWVSLVSDDDMFCEVLKLWRPDVAILKESSRIGANLVERDCAETWSMYHQCGQWQLFVSQKQLSRVSSMSKICRDF